MEVASVNCPECGSLVLVRYSDHVLFRNCSSETVKPMRREVVGWIARQNEEAIWIVCDRPLGPIRLKDRARGILESGLVVLRKDISELKQFC